MRCLLLAVVIFALPALVAAQGVNTATEIKMMKDATARIAVTGKHRARIVLRDLREFEGKVFGLQDDHFFLDPKKKKVRSTPIIVIGNPGVTRKAPVRIFYKDLLQIDGEDIAMSVVPDPQKPVHGAWDDLTGIGVGEFLHIRTKDSRNIYGAFFAASGDTLALMRGNTKTDVAREDIARVFRVTGDTRSLSSKLLGGTKKGTEISDDIFPILDPAARAHPIVLAIGAGIGALIYVLPKGGTKRVLVYAQ